MPRYAISIQVSAQRIADLEPLPVNDPGKDPMTQVVAAMDRMGGMLGRDPFNQPKQSGAGMSRAIEVTTESFAGLAEILGKFDRLAEEIECSHP
jgi:hypothetical protein